MRREPYDLPNIDRIRAAHAEGTPAGDWLRTWLPPLETASRPQHSALAGALQAAGWAEAAAALAREYVAAAREHGATWADVGQLLGITRQAAQQRYSARERHDA